MAVEVGSEWGRERHFPLDSRFTGALIVSQRPTEHLA